MQFFWLYIDDFVGKGLEPILIFEFIWYQMAVLVPLALPLSILLSSLMTFGNLGEVLSSLLSSLPGISLMRFMRPLFIFTIFICGVAFFIFQLPDAGCSAKSPVQCWPILYMQNLLLICRKEFFMIASVGLLLK
jgi:lipopolysaccharide export system permease protein